MTTDMKWKEAPDTLRENYRRPPRVYGPLYDQLSAGKTLWIEDEWAGRAMGAFRAWVRTHYPTKTLRTHAQELNDEPGMIYWLEDRP